MLGRFALRLTLALGGGLLAGSAYAGGAPVTFPYSGKIVSSEGYPVAGPVDLELSFWASAAGEDLVSREPQAFPQVPLLNGVFTVTLRLDAEEASVVFGHGDAAWVELKDKTHGRTYKRVKIYRPALVPLAPAVETAAADPGAAPKEFSSSAIFQPELVQTVAAACLASQVAGAKFVTGASGTAACNAACAESRKGSACLRGWTAYENGATFDFGNECAVAETGGATPPIGRLCCCLANGGPTPVLGENLRSSPPVAPSAPGLISH